MVRPGDILARKISIHVEAGQWDIVEEILRVARQKWEAARSEHERRKPTAIAELDIATGIVNSLDDFGVVFLEELLRMPRDEFLRIPNLGERKLLAVLSALAAHGFSGRLIDDCRAAGDC